MTLEELQAMSDAELNELAAVKVMGYNQWEELPGGYHPFQGNYDWLENEANYPHVVKYPNGRVILWKIPSADGRDWQPATDMNDAIMIADKATKDSKFSDVTISIPMCVVIFHRHSAEELIVDTEDSLPRAITIAAILAKESE